MCNEIVVLYDGECGFCNRTVRFIISRDPKRRIRFAPLQGVYAARIMKQFPSLQEVDSLVLVETSGDGFPVISVRSEGAFRVARHLGGWWHAWTLAAVIPRPVRDLMYDLFARHRYALFGKYDVCPIPPPEIREQFLD